MRSDEVKDVLKLLAGLFPNQLTPEQVRLVADSLVPHRYDHAVAAAKNHRLNHDFFTFPQFFEGLRAMDQSREARQQERDNERVIDSLRRTYNPDPKVPAEDVIVSYFSDCWSQVKDQAEPGRSSVRAMLFNHCQSALMQLLPDLQRQGKNWTVQDCNDQSRCVVGLMPGEKIRVPSLLKTATYPKPASSGAEIIKLAREYGAEHKAGAA